MRHPCPRAPELAKTLLGFKEVFLVGFFLTIGLSGLPTWETTLAAVILLVILPIKGGLFYLLLTRFKLRARGATQSSAILTNYSEFGLIVAAIALNINWLPAEWVTILALALSFSFLLAAPLNNRSDDLYEKFHDWLVGWEQEARLPEDEAISIVGNCVLILGMGKVGQAAYDEMVNQTRAKVIGIDVDKSVVEENHRQGRNVVFGDASHPEFWSLFADGHEGVKMALLATPNHQANIMVADNLREHGYKGALVATALYSDQEADLKEHGITEVYNVYNEVGLGVATHMFEAMEQMEK